MTTQTNKISFTDTLRHIAQPVLNAVGQGLLKIGITPNMATIIGCAGNIIASVFIAQGKLTIGGLIALFWVLFDAVDGTMARISNQVSNTGAFLDSTLDRYVEFFLFTGLIWYFTTIQSSLGILLAVITLAGSLLISYTRARAEGLGYECKVGLLTRVERFIIFIPSLLFQIPLIGLGIMAVLTHITAIQRILHVVKQADQKNE